MYCDDCIAKGSGTGTVCTEVKIHWVEGKIELFHCENKQKQKEKPFPKIMKSISGCVVGFTSPKCGYVLQLPTDNDFYKLFECKEDWIMRSFEDME